MPNGPEQESREVVTPELSHDAERQVDLTRNLILDGIEKVNQGEKVEPILLSAKKGDQEIYVHLPDVAEAVEKFLEIDWQNPRPITDVPIRKAPPAWQEFNTRYEGVRIQKEIGLTDLTLITFKKKS